MSNQSHNHWERYHVRIRRKPYYGELTEVKSDLKVDPSFKDFIQCICLDDGIIFNEHVIRYE